jgi:hypothetical protein
MAKHLSACPQRRAVFEQAEGKKAGAETIHHLRVQDGYGGYFWLDLEMRGSARLEDLDQYLRAIWLECCGHLSQFSIGGWGGEEIPMGQTIDKVFKPGVELTHIYDFGTESVSKVKSFETRKGKPTTPNPIALMARNLMPEVKCMECKKPAMWLCNECIIEERKSGLLCTEHADDHPCENYGDPLLLANSPRMGMCGYEGPADPPY